MARTENRERDRWPEAQQEEYEQEAGTTGRWPDAEPAVRWPEAESEARWSEAPTGRRRAGRLRVEIPPIINPYAIVALVAALLGLFPVAIVFGFIAFTHPRGKTMAVFALLMGVAEVTAIVGFVVLTGTGFGDALSGANRATTVSAVGLPSSIAVTTAPPTTVAPPVTTPPVATTTVTPKKGTTCVQSAQIGTGTDGSTLICLGSPGALLWAGPYTVASTVAEAGAKCDSAPTKSARTADGRALVCEGKTWALWAE